MGKHQRFAAKIYAHCTLHTHIAHTNKLTHTHSRQEAGGRSRSENEMERGKQNS